MSGAEVRQHCPATAVVEGLHGGKPAPAHSAGRTRMAENLQGILFCHSPSRNRAGLLSSDNWKHEHTSASSIS